MEAQELNRMTVPALRALAEERGLHLPSKMTKAAILERLAAAQPAAAKESAAEEPARAPRRPSPKPRATAKPAAPAKTQETAQTPAQTETPVAAETPAAVVTPAQAHRAVHATVRPRPVTAPHAAQTSRPAEPTTERVEKSEDEPAAATDLSAFENGAGVLDVQADGYGYLRAENCLPGARDVYISAMQIRRFNLRQGDYVEGKIRPQREGDRCGAMIYVYRVNGTRVTEPAYRTRPLFDTLVPLYPQERLRLAAPENGDIALRMVDLLTPIGKGQRGMIVAQPKTGKTTLLKKIANAIAANNPEVTLLVLLIDERPEEVTDMKRSINGTVVYSAFDEEPENHTRVSEMVLEYAQRQVEMGKDVVILLDSITRLARAYNLTITPTGRSLSGGLDPGALYKPKRFFGAARNIENGGSLTIIATALVDTGSRMDDIIFEEFKGTGNMELKLDRKLADKRIFPAIDAVRSGTRREDLLFTPAELEGVFAARRMLTGDAQQNAENLLSLLHKTSNNTDLLNRIKGWQKVYEKDGFV